MRQVRRAHSSAFLPWSGNGWWTLLKTDGTVNGVAEIGDYMFSGAPSAETNYRKLCNGQELAQADYPDLYALIGATYGAASNPVTLFKLPDFRGRMPVASDHSRAPSVDSVALAATGGLQEVILDGTTTGGLTRPLRWKVRSNSGATGDGAAFIVDAAPAVPAASGRRIGGAGDAKPIRITSTI